MGEQAAEYGWNAQQLAAVAGAQLLAGGEDGSGPSGVSIDTRTLRPGELFIGLAGEQVDGGEHAFAALAAGAWGVLVAPEYADRLTGRLAELPDGNGDVLTTQPAIFAAELPLRSLHLLATAWRRQLGAKVFAVTGSVGKTSTKEILATLLSEHMRVVASPENFNTEIGMPLSILAAARGTEAIVLELAMRGAGQIGELTAIAEPDVGVIVNVAPVHLELLGSIEAIAAAKAELFARMQPGGIAVLPAGERLLDGRVPEYLRRITFGPDGDVRLCHQEADASVQIEAAGRMLQLQPNFSEQHNLHNLLAAVAACIAVGLEPQGPLHVNFAPLRGEVLELSSGALLINDCYNANPLSMRAALSELARRPAARRIAVLGDMRELGEQSRALHGELAAAVTEAGVQLLVTVGRQAAAIAEQASCRTHSVADARAAAQLLAGQLKQGDVVLVKGSRALGMECIADRLQATAAVA